MRFLLPEASKHYPEPFSSPPGVIGHFPVFCVLPGGLIWALVNFRHSGTLFLTKVMGHVPFLGINILIYTSFGPMVGLFGVFGHVWDLKESLKTEVPCNQPPPP